MEPVKVRAHFNDSAFLHRCLDANLIPCASTMCFLAGSATNLTMIQKHPSQGEFYRGVLRSRPCALCILPMCMQSPFIIGFYFTVRPCPHRHARPRGYLKPGLFVRLLAGTLLIHPRSIYTI